MLLMDRRRESSEQYPCAAWLAVPIEPAVGWLFWGPASCPSGVTASGVVDAACWAAAACKSATTTVDNGCRTASAMTASVAVECSGGGPAAS